MLVPLDGGRRVFVDMRGEIDTPALLYIHGGPGQGSYEFMAAQGDRLARTLLVIGFDQRGVLRSDPLDAQSLSLEQLVEDCEALRRELKIDRWTVLAHSIGALTAVHYAVANPQHVSRLILDCPCLDLPDSTSNLLSRAESLLRDAGRNQLADLARDARAIPEAAQRWIALTHIWPQLNDLHPTLYFRRAQAAQWFDSVRDLASISAEERHRAAAHAAALQTDPELFQPVTPLLGQLTQPSLLIKGEHDPVCTAAQLDAFQKHVRDQHVVVLPDTAHYPQIEEQDAYTTLVATFTSAAS